MRKISLQLNHLSEELAASGGKDNSGKFVMAPTDSRLRGDQRLFENGKQVEADDEKLRLETKQRQARKDLEQLNQTHE